MDINLTVSNNSEQWEALKPLVFAEKIGEIEKICCRWVAFYSLYEDSIAYGVKLKVYDDDKEIYSSHIITDEDLRSRIEQHVKPLELLFRFPRRVEIDHKSEHAVVEMYTVEIEAEVYRKYDTKNRDLSIMQNKLKESLKGSLGKLLM